jgi:hypothetical protein
MTIEADARLGKEVKVTVPSPAVPFGSLVDFTVERNDFSQSFSGGTDGTIPGFTARLDGNAPVSGLVSDVQWYAGVPGPDGVPSDSPTMYQGAWFFKEVFPTGFERTMTPQNTGRVDTVVHQHVADTIVVPFVMGQPADDLFAGGSAFGWDNHLPLHRTTYFSTDPSARFVTELDEFDADFNQVSLFRDRSRQYLPGSVQAQHWNNAAFGPSFASAELPWEFMTRTQDILVLEPPLLSDGSGHAGYSLYTSAKSTLWRNGKVFATDTTPWLDVEVPPAAADYKYTVEVQRSGPLSTKVSSTWTFRSQHVAESQDPLTAFRQLPLTTVSFAPAVDDHNKVAAGQIAIVPITVTAQNGAKPLASLTVESSINDGKAWNKAAVFHVGSSWYALVPQKSGATVSLRANGTDAAGKTIVDLTVIRAYQVK